jgi:EmrB/QacA subfamily drug resistance transporter
MTAIEDRQSHHLTFAVLAVAVLAFALLQSIVAPALRTIQADLHASTTGGAWILTSYLLSVAVATPIAGRFGDMFGKKRLLVISLGFLTLGSALAALATSIDAVVVGRVVQGFGGATAPLAFGIIRDEFPSRRVHHGIALMASVIGIGTALGLVIAGPIVAHLSYAWLFWFPFGATLLATVVAALFIPESPTRTRGRVDWLGAGLLAGWLVALLTAVSEGPNWGWSSRHCVGLLVLAAVLCAAWALAAARIHDPLIQMRMMRMRAIWTTNLASMLIGFGMFSSFVLVPQLVELPKTTGFGFGASVTKAGIFLLPMAGSMLVVAPIAGWLASAFGSRLPLVLGILFSFASFVLLAFAHAASWQIYLGTLVMGVGFGLVFSSMVNLTLEAAPAEQTGVATGINSIARIVGSSFGSQVSAVILASGLAASGLPTERSFTIAFSTAAAALALAAAVTLLIPRRVRCVCPGEATLLARAA